MRYPFEVALEELLADVDNYVSSVFATLESEFLTLPRGKGFIDYPTFEGAYQTLATDGKVFTLKNLSRIVACSDLARFAVQPTS